MRTRSRRILLFARIAFGGLCLTALSALACRSYRRVDDVHWTGGKVRAHALSGHGLLVVRLSHFNADVPEERNWDTAADEEWLMFANRAPSYVPLPPDLAPAWHDSLMVGHLEGSVSHEYWLVLPAWSPAAVFVAGSLCVALIRRTRLGSRCCGRRGREGRGFPLAPAIDTPGEADRKV